MKTQIDIRSLVLGALAGIISVLCLGAAAGTDNHEPAILKLQNEAGLSIAVVTLLNGSGVVPIDPLTETRTYRQDIPGSWCRR